VTAAPNTGFHFVGWTQGGKQVSIPSSYMFTIPSKVITLIADF
jgi:hypothetical protein